MAVFKARFDDLKRVPHEAALADEGLRWLARQKNASGTQPLVILNHPNRVRRDALASIKDIKRWRAVGARHGRIG